MEQTKSRPGRDYFCIGSCEWGGFESSEDVSGFGSCQCCIGMSLSSEDQGDGGQPRAFDRGLARMMHPFHEESKMNSHQI